MIEMIIGFTVVFIYIYLKEKLVQKNKVKFDMLSDRI